MLTARALGRALSSSKGAAAQPLLRSLACTTSSVSSFSPLQSPLFSENSSWTSILDSYTRRSTSTACFASSGVSQDREEKKSQARTTLQPAAQVPAAAQRYLGTASEPATSLMTTNKRKRKRSLMTSAPVSANQPSSSAMDSNVDGSGGYMLLSFAHATAASMCLFMPEAIANFFVPGTALPQGFESQALVQLLGSGLAAGSAACYALKQYADNNDLKAPTAQRLQLGLMGFSAAAIGTHLMYIPALTVAALGTGAAVVGATGGVAFSSYIHAVGPVRVGDVMSRYFGAIPDHLRIKNLQCGLFSLLTPTLALAGLTYVALPGYSLAEIFGYVKGTDAFFWWQSIGGALVTLAPVLTYSLKAEADAGRLGEPVAKTLSAGLLVTSLGHLWVLLPMLMNEQGGNMLPYLVGAWATAATAGVLGLWGGSSSAAGAAGKV